MTRRLLTLLLLGATALGCSGRYEVGGMSASGTSSVGGSGQSHAGSTSASGGSGGAMVVDPSAAGELGTTCVPLGEPAAPTGPFVDGNTLWRRVAPFIFGGVTPTPSALSGDVVYEVVDDVVRQSFAQALAEGGSLGAKMFVGEWLRHQSEDALELAGDWAQLLPEDAPALPILLQSRLPGTGRIGVFTEPDWLARHRTISARGSGVSASLFQQAPPPPPSGFENGPPDPILTDREALAQQLGSEPACAGCHHLIDPLGFPLGQFDAAGNYRELDHGLPVDLSGSYVREDLSIEYDGLMDFGVKVADTCLANRALAQAILRLALDMREMKLEAREELVNANLERVAQAFIRSGRSYPDLVVAYAQSPLALRP